MGHLGTNFSEILIKIQNVSFTKMHLKRSYARFRPSCTGGDELTHRDLGAVSIRKTVLPGMAIPMLKIRLLTAVLSLTWKSPYVDKTVFILRRGPDDVSIHHWIGSPLAQLMTCCRMTPSHYLNNIDILSAGPLGNNYVKFGLESKKQWYGNAFENVV